MWIPCRIINFRLLFSLLNGEFSRDPSLQFTLQHNPLGLTTVRVPYDCPEDVRETLRNICSVWIISPFPLKWEINFNMIIFGFLRGSLECTHVRRFGVTSGALFYAVVMLVWLRNARSKIYARKWQLQMTPSHASSAGSYKKSHRDSPLWAYSEPLIHALQALRFG